MDYIKERLIPFNARIMENNYNSFSITLDKPLKDFLYQRFKIELKRHEIRRFYIEIFPDELLSKEDKN